jgi:hypothetical protein
MLGFSMKRTALDGLRRLIEASPAVDWRAVALDRAVLDALDWRELDPAVIVPLLKAYQRLLRILPPGEDHRALLLLDSGLHSAIQIADLARDELLRRWGALFPGEQALGLAVHRAAIARRGELLLHHINEVQRNEPHYRAARFK